MAADLAQRAANEGGTLDEARLVAYSDEGRRRLGRYGDDARFRFAFADADGDGVDDTVAVTVDASLPILLPVRWSGYSPTDFSRTMRARIEVFQEEPAGGVGAGVCGASGARPAAWRCCPSGC